MSITSVNKQVSPASIPCGGTFRVTLTLNASPDDGGAAGATNILVSERLNPDFEIAEILPPTIGTASQTDGRSLTWTIQSLGTGSSETAVLSFQARHTGQTSGTLAVNDSIVLTDQEGDSVVFPAPAVTASPCEAPAPIFLDAEIPFGTSRQYELFCVPGAPPISSIQINAQILDVMTDRCIQLTACLEQSGRETGTSVRQTQDFYIPARHCRCRKDIVLSPIVFSPASQPPVSDNGACVSPAFRLSLSARIFNGPCPCEEIPEIE